MSTTQVLKQGISREEAVQRAKSLKLPSRVVNTLSIEMVRLCDLLLRREMTPEEAMVIYGAAVDEIWAHRTTSDLRPMILYVAGHRRLVECSDFWPPDHVLLALTGYAVRNQQPKIAEFLESLRKRIPEGSKEFHKALDNFERFYVLSDSAS